MYKLITVLNTLLHKSTCIGKGHHVAPSSGPVVQEQREQREGERIDTTPSLDFSEACEHGFADCVFVRVGGGEVVVATFGSETGSLRSQLSLEMTKRRTN